MALGKAAILALAALGISRKSHILARLGKGLLLLLAVRELLRRRKCLEANLKGQVAVVTGASKGIGKGIAVGLGEAGATVYITGRSVTKKPGQLGSLEETKEEVERAGGICIAVGCDSGKDADLEALFAQVMREQGKLDILVNVAFSAVDNLPKVAGIPFWEKGIELWDQVNHVGLRSHYVASYHAVRCMSKAKRGLIVNCSSFGGMNYIFDVAYGIGKAGMDRMANDMAVEVATENITMVSLWPGLVKTEYVQSSPGDFGKLTARRGLPPGQPAMDTAGAMPTPLAETPLFNGRAVAALARDPRKMDYTGKIMVPGRMAAEFDFKDERGVRSPSLLSLKGLLSPLFKALLQMFGAWDVPGNCYAPQPGLSFAAKLYWNALPNGDVPALLMKLIGGNGNIG